MDAFWRTTPLAAMTPAQWESLCDGCGRCCLHKLREDGTGRLHHTEVACRLLDVSSARCTDYPNRRARVPDCLQLTPAMVEEVDWLPPTCAYRLVAEGRDLPAWHPLVSGDPGSVARAGVSVAGRCVSERRAGALEDHLRRWPGQWPRQAGPKPPAKGRPA
ncbi:YcgN family cysteine cluster protein [Roseococcus sp. DSY-14]|uniref:YcgN family cysteine cluster protein n=1 Tax=Roseococcus sp. DSY-14 TaxID=3369650 RepID=UPI00387ADBEC